MRRDSSIHLRVFQLSCQQENDVCAMVQSPPPPLSRFRRAVCRAVATFFPISINFWHYFSRAYLNICPLAFRFQSLPVRESPLFASLLTAKRATLPGCSLTRSNVLAPCSSSSSLVTVLRSRSHTLFSAFEIVAYRLRLRPPAKCASLERK